MSGPVTDSRQSAVLVINTASRRGRDCYERVRKRLEDGGLLLSEAHAVRRPKSMPAIVQAAIDRGARMIVLGGGDGTVTSAAGSFANKDVVLGLLPIGTGNSFARGLGVPLDLDAAVDTILTGTVARVDLATINGTYFANAASIGLSTAVGVRTPGALKRIVGPLAYVITGIRETLVSRAFRFRFVDDGGKVYTGQTQQMVIANGPMFGTTPILPDATLSDERLAVYALRGPGRITIAKMWLGMLLGGFHTRLDAALSLHTRTLEISTSPRRTIDIDGELRFRTPATFAVVPGALRVMVPQHGPGGS